MVEQQDRAKAAEAWRTLGLRVVSSVVLAPIAIGVVWVGGVPLLVMLVVATGLMALEWERVSFGGVAAPMVGLPMLAVATAGIGLAWPGSWWIALVSGLLAVPIAWALALVFGRPAGWAALGAAYVSLPCLAFLWLRAEPGAGRVVVLWLMLSVWATDIGAYFAGRAIGGPKLAPRISPNKTWAGLAGGVLAAALVGAATAATSEIATVQRMMLGGVATAVLAQAGDLSKSAWKRHFRVKDSGSLIPGHGGVIDRLDGLLFVALGAAMMALLNGGRLLPWE